MKLTGATIINGTLELVWSDGTSLILNHTELDTLYDEGQNLDEREVGTQQG